MASVATSAFASQLRILGMTASTGGLDTVSVNAQGTGYSVSDVLTLTGGNSDGTVTVLTIGGGGEVLTVSRTTPGTGYSVASGLATTGGGGSGCTIDVDTILYVLAELQNVDGPDSRVNLIDVTNHQSPNGAEEVIPGVVVGGEVTFEGNFVDDTSQSQAKTDHQAKTIRSYEIYVPVATPIVRTFNGYLSALNFTGPADGKTGFSGALKVTGLPNLG